MATKNWTGLANEDEAREKRQEIDRIAIEKERQREADRDATIAQCKADAKAMNARYARRAEQAERKRLIGLARAMRNETRVKQELLRKARAHFRQVHEARRAKAQEHRETREFERQRIAGTLDPIAFKAWRREQQRKRRVFAPVPVGVIDKFNHPVKTEEQLIRDPRARR